MDDRTQARFRRRLGLATVLGLLAGLVFCLRLEAAAPLANAPFAWRRPPAPEIAAAQKAAAREAANEDAAEQPLDALARSIDPAAGEARDGHLVQALPDGRNAVFTFDPTAQARIRDLLVRQQVPFGAVVALDPRTGEIRALVEVANENPTLRGLARKAIAPAASVFKIITTAALIEEAQLEPTLSVCYHGGLHGIGAGHLRDDPLRDDRCESMAEALARSSNAVYAKLADRALDALALRRTAESFGFERAVPFLWPVEVSPARIPTERLERARAAAGFWHTRLSPLHAALVAAAIANDGVIMRPTVLRAVVDADGRPTLELPQPAPWIRAVRPETAHAIAEMMEGTVTFGTASRTFAEDKRPAPLAGMRIAGKTGSLSSTGAEPFHFSWFVGFAPADDPQIAIAVLMVNRPAWRIKAPTVALQALGWLLEPRAAQPAQGN